MPLAAHIRKVLEDRPSHHAVASRFRDELEDYMSDVYAEETLKTAIQWGRYAETYAYDETRDLFTLEVE